MKVPRKEYGDTPPKNACVLPQNQVVQAHAKDSERSFVGHDCLFKGECIKSHVTILLVHQEGDKETDKASMPSN